MYLLKTLETKSYFQCINFLSLNEIKSLNSCLDKRLTNGAMYPAGIGKGADRVNSIRSDSISWWNPEHLSPDEQSVLTKIHSIKENLNHHLYLGLQEVELHYAVYQQGGFYRRHRDRFSSDDARVLSLVIFLNAKWQEEQGGQLVLYLPEQPLKISPSPGMLVGFLSAEIEHEVLPTQQERRTLTGWFKRRT